MLNDILTEVRNANYWLRQHAHWGLWNDGIGWWGTTPPEIFMTTSRAHAEAQREIVAQSADTHRFEWHVKCFEEWADEQSG